MRFFLGCTIRCAELLNGKRILFLTRLQPALALSLLTATIVTDSDHGRSRISIWLKGGAYLTGAGSAYPPKLRLHYHLI